MKKILKYLIISIACFGLFSGNFYATVNEGTLADLRQELKALKTKKNNQEQKTAQTKTEIATAKTNIYNSQEEIRKNQKVIDDAKIEIANLNIEIAKTKELIKKTMNSYQAASGENIYLEYLFNSNSYADLVYRYVVVEQIARDNTEKINSWNEKINYNEELKIELAAKEIELQNKIAEMEKNVSYLGNRLAEYSEITMDINDEIKSTQETIDYLVSVGCGENDDVATCLSINGDIGFNKPLTKGTITSLFGYRTHPVTGAIKSFHGAVDIGGNSEGTNIYATAAGTVGKVIYADMNNKVCGGRAVYIWHKIGGKLYTSAYLHLLKVNVKVGDTVTKNSVVGTVGGGKSTPWDGCSTGPHLHFAIAFGWYGITCKDGRDCYTSYSTWIAKSQDPQKILGLPKKGVWWYSR